MYSLLRSIAWTLAAALLLGQGGGLAPAAHAAVDPAGMRLVVRSGDPAPVPVARLRGGLRCGPAATESGAVFVDAAGTGLFLADASGPRPLAYAGEETAAGSRFATFGCPVGGLEGGLTVPVVLADGRAAIYAIDPAGATSGELLATGATLPLRGGTATAIFLWGHAADAAGGIVLPVAFDDGGTALVHVDAAGDPEVLAQGGDPLGPGTIAWIAGARPAVNRAGTIAFAAVLETGDAVLATLRPGETPVVMFLAPPGGAAMLAPQGPAIDEAGNVAFAWFDRGVIRLQQVAGGLSRTLAGPGTPVAGGGTVLVLAPVEPIAGDAGEVIFGALLADGREGILAAGPGSVRPLVLTGQTAGEAGLLEAIPPALPPAIGPDGLLFAGRAAGIDGVLGLSGGEARFLARAGDPIDGSVRFASFLETRTQFLGAGPAVAPGGALIFDARVTGGGRGLFARRRAGGPLEPVVMGGGPAAGGGVFADDVFSFHSINADGAYVFLGTAGGAAAETVALYYGRLGSGAPRKVADAGPYFERGGQGASYLPVPPPSRINRAGEVLFTYRNGDGSDVLACYDGVDLFFVAAPGHPVAGDDRLAMIFTGSSFLGVPIPPQLDDTGNVLFGGFTERGDVGLFRARCAAGGGGAAERIVGGGDEVEGGRLSPFELQALQAGADGRIAFQAVYSDQFDFGLFLRDATGTRPVARRFDLVPDIGFLFSVTPRLALLGGDRLVFGAVPFAGTEALLIRDPAAAMEPRLLAGRETDSPDGGRFRDFQASGGPGLASRTTARLSSDGTDTVAFAASTTAGPEGIFLYGGSAGTRPVADAGSAQRAECAGPDGTEILLDGRASADADGDPLIFTWTGPFGIAGGPQPAVRLPLGSHRIRLVVSDGTSESEPAEVAIDVLDTRPPVLAVGATPEALWPPDGRMADVALGVEAADLCDPAPRLMLLSVTSDDGGASGRPGMPILGAELGTDDRALRLRAERAGGSSGRTYTITYGAIDASDNAVMATTAVVVPHDRSRP